MDGNKLLDLTGGVGRRIDAIVHKSAPETPALPAYAMVQPHLLALFCDLLSVVPRDQFAAPFWPPYGIMHRQAVKLLERRGVATHDAISTIAGWCDAGHFLLNGGLLEIQRPAVLRAFAVRVDYSQSCSMAERAAPMRMTPGSGGPTVSGAGRARAAVGGAGTAPAAVASSADL